MSLENVVCCSIIIPQMNYSFTFTEHSGTLFEHHFCIQREAKSIEMLPLTGGITIYKYNITNKNE